MRRFALTALLALSGCIQWAGGPLTNHTSITESETAVNWATGNYFFATIDGLFATTVCTAQSLPCQYAHLAPGTRYSFLSLPNPTAVQNGGRTDHCLTGDQFIAFRQSTQTLAVTRMLVNGATGTTYGHCLYTSTNDGVSWHVQLIDEGGNNNLDGVRIGFDRTNWYMAQFARGTNVIQVNQITGAVQYVSVPTEQRVVGRSAEDTNAAYFAGWDPSYGGDVRLRRLLAGGALETYAVDLAGYTPLTPTGAWRSYGVPPRVGGVELADMWIDVPRNQIFLALHGPCPFTPGAMCGVIQKIVNAPMDFLGNGRHALDDPFVWAPTAIYGWTTDYPGNPGTADIGGLRIAPDSAGEPLYTARWMSPYTPDATQLGGGDLTHEYLTRYVYQPGSASCLNASTANRCADWLGAYPDRASGGVWVTTSYEKPAPPGSLTPAVGVVNMLLISRAMCIGPWTSGCTVPR